MITMMMLLVQAAWAGPTFTCDDTDSRVSCAGGNATIINPTEELNWVTVGTVDDPVTLDWEPGVGVAMHVVPQPSSPDWVVQVRWQSPEIVTTGDIMDGETPIAHVHFIIKA